MYTKYLIEFTNYNSVVESYGFTNKSQTIRFISSNRRYFKNMKFYKLDLNKIEEITFDDLLENSKKKKELY